MSWRPTRTTCRSRCRSSACSIWLDSGERTEIVSAMRLDHQAKSLRRDHLHRVAPGIEVPRHLQVSCRLEADEERAVGELLCCLLGMKQVAPGVVGRRRAEPPDDV